MADNKGRDGISQITFFSVVVQIYISMSIVLTAAGKPEDHWFRTFTQCYLALMVVVYTAGMLYVIWQRKKKARAAAGESGAQS